METVVRPPPATAPGAQGGVAKKTSNWSDLKLKSPEGYPGCHQGVSVTARLEHPLIWVSGLKSLLAPPPFPR
jgi:hypothetical protein